MNASLSTQGLSQWRDALARHPQLAMRRLLAAMTTATFILQREVQDAMPAVSGLTRGSIAADAFAVPAGVLGVVGSPQPVALFVELGTRPHWAPIEPLRGWVRERLGLGEKEAARVAHAIQRKIAKQGTRPQYIFKHALERMQPSLVAVFEHAAAQLAADLNGGVA